MSNITSNWFYLIDESFETEIHVQDDIFVSLLIINSQTDRKIFLWKNSKVEFFGYFSDKTPANIDFYQYEEQSSLHIRKLFVGNKNSLTTHINSHIKNSQHQTHIQVIAIVGEEKFHIDSALKIEKNAHNIDAHLALENICIWENGSVTSLPNLFVESNDVQVSHSSKTHRLPENKVFYLESRGLSHDESTLLLAQSYFSKTFSCLEMYNKEKFEELQASFSQIIS